MEQFFEGEIKIKQIQRTTYDDLYDLAISLGYKHVADAVGNKNYEEKAKTIKTKSNGK